MPFQSNRPGPLTDKHLEAINRNLRALHDWRAHADRAEACGIDCQAMRDAAGQYEAIYTKLKQQYFPGEP